MNKDMLERLKEGAYFQVHCGGVEFELRRRTTLIMLEVGGIQRVLSLLAEQRESDEEAEADVKAYLDAQSRAMAVILHRVGGEVIDPETFDFTLVAPYADSLFVAFLGSGVEVTPTRGSLKGGREPS